MSAERDTRPIVLFDGVCGMCNALVQNILRHDTEGALRFASLQSSFARELMKKHGRDPDAIDTLYLVLDPGTERERLLWKSRAALRVARHMGLFYRIVRIFGFLPAGILDFAYDVVATHRYRIFGKKESCMIPTTEQRARFVAV